VCKCNCRTGNFVQMLEVGGLKEFLGEWKSVSDELVEVERERSERQGFSSGGFGEGGELGQFWVRGGGLRKLEELWWSGSFGGWRDSGRGDRGGGDGGWSGRGDEWGRNCNGRSGRGRSGRSRNDGRWNRGNRGRWKEGEGRDER
jgi:hypothetical protein